jgi:hypothetical protein
LPERWALVERAPAALRVGDGLYLAAAGVERAVAMALVRAALAKSGVPEPLRVAHLIARALVRGESRDRVRAGARPSAAASGSLRSRLYA